MSIHVPVGVLLVTGALALTAHAAPPTTTPGIRAAQAWNAPQRPFRIYGRTYYVGPHGLSSILVDTGHGLVLFDGGLPASAPRIETSIRALGYRVRDIRWILNSHAHGDHAGGIAALQRDSGAQVLASAAGKHALEARGIDPADPQFGNVPDYPAPHDVRLVADGETVRLGGLAVTAHYTPGHTPGSTTWTWTSCEAKGCLHVVYADSLTAMAAPGFRFADHPRRVAAFRRAIATVAALPCDILLTPHPDASGFWAKRARQDGDRDAAWAVDTGACRAYATAAARTLDSTLEREAGASRQR